MLASKWIGTYNLYGAHLLRFFKWLYSPNIEPDKRPKPEVVQNKPQLKRKEKSIYKPTDLWTPEDDMFIHHRFQARREFDIKPEMDLCKFGCSTFRRYRHYFYLIDLRRSA